MKKPHAQCSWQAWVAAGVLLSCLAVAPAAPDPTWQNLPMNLPRTADLQVGTVESHVTAPEPAGKPAVQVHGPLGSSKWNRWLSSKRGDLPAPPGGSTQQTGAVELAVGLFDSSSGRERLVEFALKESARDARGFYRISELVISIPSRPTSHL